MLLQTQLSEESKRKLTMHSFSETALEVYNLLILVYGNGYKINQSNIDNNCW